MKSSAFSWHISKRTATTSPGSNSRYAGAIPVFAAAIAEVRDAHGRLLSLAAFTVCEVSLGAGCRGAQKVSGAARCRDGATENLNLGRR